MAKKQKETSFVMWAKPNFAQVVRSNKNFRSNFHGAMTYVHHEMSSIELKKEVVKYLKALDPKHPLLDQIKDIHENRLAVVGKYMYIVNSGGELPEDIDSALYKSLEKVIDEENVKKEKAKREAEFISQQSPSEGNEELHRPIKAVITIQDRLKEKTQDIAGEVEGWLDDWYLGGKSTVKTVEEFVNFFKSKELKAAHMRYMSSFFERRAEEAQMLVETKDKDLLEGYSNFSKPELKRYAQFFSNLLQACSMMQEIAKVERAPRKKKPVSQEKLVAKVKYKKEDKSLGIVSINPTQVIGAKELWLFNTKTRKIARFVADDLLGPMSIKGTTLTGFNEAKSVSKTLRKPAEQLAEFKKAGKVALRTFMDNIKAVEVKANGRLNEDIVILKVV